MLKLFFNKMFKLYEDKILFAQVDLFSFGADLIIFVEQFNEMLLYLTEL